MVWNRYAQTSLRPSDVQTLAFTMKKSQALQREEPRHLHSCQRACFDASTVQELMVDS